MSANQLQSMHCRGVATLECAIALPVAMLVLLGTLDLGLAATRYNALAEGSRRTAREAILHGELAPSETGTWGPAEIATVASEDSPIVTPLRRVLPTMDPDRVSVRVSWLDGSNAPRDRVQVELDYLHTPLLPGVLPWGPMLLRSSTTMRIVN